MLIEPKQVPDQGLSAAAPRSSSVAGYVRHLAAPYRPQISKNLVLVCLLACAVAVTSAFADTPSNLKGTWIVDAKATEAYVVGAPLPPNAYNLAQWFGLAGGYMSLFTYEFADDLATFSAYRGDRVMQYQRVSEKGAETVYVLKEATGSKGNTLAVSILSNGNIRIVPSESPEMSSVLWKRGQLKTEKATPEEVMAVTHVWLASVQNIVTALRKPPN